MRGASASGGEATEVGEPRGVKTDAQQRDDCLKGAGEPNTGNFLARPGAGGPFGTPVGKPWFMTSAAVDETGRG